MSLKCTLDLEHFFRAKEHQCKIRKTIYFSLFSGLLGAEWVVRSPFLVIMFSQIEILKQFEEGNLDGKKKKKKENKNMSVHFIQFSFICNVFYKKKEEKSPFQNREYVMKIIMGVK